jgi:hypothetical protein
MLKYNIMVMFVSKSELATIFSPFKPMSVILETSVKLQIKNTVS